MKKYYDFYWEKLDNVGTFYASTSTMDNPNIYRLSVKLKEKVNVGILEEALNNTLLTIPSFKVKLRKGFFWYYLERNNSNPVIREDQYFPFTMINNFDNNYFLFKVTYFEKRINVDFSHILTDGTGALHFLETLVTNYMKIKHPKKVKASIVVSSELLSKNEMSVDSFLKYSTTKQEKRKIMKERSRKSYLISGSRTNKKGTNVIIGTMSVNQLKTIAKSKNVTITAYLTAVLIYAIYKENYKYRNSKDPIVICIPVNLRNYFASYSMNNFFSTILAGIDLANRDYTFDEVLETVSTKIKSELDQDVLLEKFKFFVGLQRNIILRFIPLVVKDILLRSISSVVSERGSTCTLSNLGIVSVADEVKEYIDKFDLIAYNDTTLPMKIGVCSFDDKLSVTFSSVITETEIQKCFFTYLAEQGIDIKVSASISEIETGGPAQ